MGGLPAPASSSSRPDAAAACLGVLDMETLRHSIRRHLPKPRVLHQCVCTFV